MFIPQSKTVLTFKAGKWNFTAACNTAEIYPLLVRARTLFEAVYAIPILPAWQSKLKTELMRRSVFGTAAIEGNPLTQEEVSAEVRNTEPVTDASKARKEIHNLARLYDSLNAISSDGCSLTEDTVKNFHAIIADGLAFEDNIPGHYRVADVQVGDNAHGGVYIPPKIVADVKALMETFFAWFNDEETQKMDPLLLAACAHYYLVRIHPFRDGNGRTARFAEAYVLACAGMPLIAPMLSNYYYRHKDEYFCVISETARHGDMTPFFTFFLTAFYEELHIVLHEIIPSINALLLKDFTGFLRQSKRITQRQKALFDIMLDHGLVISQEDLTTNPALAGYYRSVSRSTALRDLKRLTGLGVLSVVDRKYRINGDCLKI